MHVLDTALIVIGWTFLLTLSLLSLWRVFGGHPVGYGQLPLLPESWRRWILDEKYNETHSIR